MRSRARPAPSLPRKRPRSTASPVSQSSSPNAKSPRSTELRAKLGDIGSQTTARPPHSNGGEGRRCCRCGVWESSNLRKRHLSSYLGTRIRTNLSCRNSPHSLIYHCGLDSPQEKKKEKRGQARYGSCQTNHRGAMCHKSTGIRLREKNIKPKPKDQERADTAPNGQVNPKPPTANVR